VIYTMIYRNLSSIKIYIRSLTRGGKTLLPRRLRFVRPEGPYDSVTYNRSNLCAPLGF